jgi:Tol biopolymer transport system component
MDPDGSKTKLVSKGDNSLYASPEWTPDGNYIIASKTNSPNRQQLPAVDVPQGRWSRSLPHQGR